jgi:hypothetical protein
MTVLHSIKLFKTLFLGFILILIVSCNEKEEEKPEITINDLTGSWTATSSIFTNNSNSSERFDLIANGGELRITVLDDGMARTWVSIDTFSDEWDAQLTITGNRITSTPVEEFRGVQTLEFTLEGSILTTTNQDDSFDFTFSGADEVAAISVTVFLRQ